MKPRYHHNFFLTALLCLTSPFLTNLEAASYEVTNTNDSGAGSLRQAIIDANNTPLTPDIIKFAISPVPIGAPSVISLESPLPDVTDQVEIAGDSQAGYVAGGPPVVLIDAKRLDDTTHVLAFTRTRLSNGGQSIVRALTINAHGLSAAAVSLNDVNNCRIEDCYLGCDETGSSSVNSGSDAQSGLGVLVTGGGQHFISNNVISGVNTGIGLTEATTENTIERNIIGLRASGGLIGGNTNKYGIYTYDNSVKNIIGTLPDGGNYISGNESCGITLQTSKNTVVGNVIGLDLDQTTPIGEQACGISLGARATKNTIGSAARAGRNLISGNSGPGLIINGDNNTIEYNHIGITDSLTNAANQGDGITISESAENNTINSNYIGFNRGDGVRVTPLTRYTHITSNSIFENSGLGINLDPFTEGRSAVTQNDEPPDSDSGPNNLQNFPVISSVAFNGTTNTITLKLASMPNESFTLEVFSNNTADPSQHGEGLNLIGSVDITTDASGVGSGDVLVSGSLANKWLTATATWNASSGQKETSEFSQAILLSPGTLSFSTAAASFAEGTNANLTILRQNGTYGPISATLTAVSGTAIVGTDTAAFAPQPVNFADGIASAQVSIALTDDSLYEGNQTFTATLSAATGGSTLGTPTVQTITITDNEAVPTISINDTNVTEGSPSISTLTLSGPAEAVITVEATASDGSAIDGSDYNTADLLASFPSGVTTTTVNFATIDDNIVEPSETFLVNLSNPSSSVTISDDQGIVTIIDNDALTITAQSITVTENNSGASNVILTINLSPAQTTAVTVNLSTANGTATAPSDFTALSNVLITFPIGATTATTLVSINGDTTVEPNESFSLVLNTPSIPSTLVNGTVTINNDDFPVASIANIIIAEDDTSPAIARFTVTLDQTAVSPVSIDYTTVNGTATSTDDFTATTSTATIAAGQSTQTIDIPLTPAFGTEPEGEVFSLNFSNPVGVTLGNTTATCTLYQFVITAITPALSGSHTISTHLSSGKSYALQSTPSLLTGSWSTLLTIVPGPGGPSNYIVPAPSSFPLFYRFLPLP